MSIITKHKIIHKLSHKTIEKVKKAPFITFEKFGNWIEAGSGNFEKTQDDGRYRENCNSFHLKIACKEHKDETKRFYWHCGKLDCISCFIQASSQRARLINERLLEYRREAMKNELKIGRLMHFTLSMKPEMGLKILDDYDNKFIQFRREIIYPMLRNSGIFAGVIFTHIRSNTCQRCGEKEKSCHCENKLIHKKFNPHFHVIGYGYIINAKKFKEKYPNFVYINHGRRNDAYHTVFYILSKVSLWRKGNGKLKPAYSYFNLLGGRKFVVANEIKTSHISKCPTCKKPREIVNSEDFREIGKPYIFRKVKRTFRILDLKELRILTQKNTLQYIKDQREAKEAIKTGNGFG